MSFSISSVRPLARPKVQMEDLDLHIKQKNRLKWHYLRATIPSNLLEKYSPHAILAAVDGCYGLTDQELGEVDELAKMVAGVRGFKLMRLGRSNHFVGLVRRERKRLRLDEEEKIKTEPLTSAPAEHGHQLRDSRAGEQQPTGNCGWQHSGNPALAYQRRLHHEPQLADAAAGGMGSMPGECDDERTRLEIPRCRKSTTNTSHSGTASPTSQLLHRPGYPREHVGGQRRAATAVHHAASGKARRMGERKRLPNPLQARHDDHAVEEDHSQVNLQHPRKDPRLVGRANRRRLPHNHPVYHSSSL